MTYIKLFDPDKTSSTEDSNKDLPGEIPINVKNFGDRCNKSVYVYNDDIILTINIAIATGRPLLVRGNSGYGKSSLAKYIADVLGWRYYEEVITSRTQAQDLLWDVDMIRRLQDAHMGVLKEITHYIRPGILWKAFDLKSAIDQKILASPSKESDMSKLQNYEKDYPPAVVLLDEVDKAYPDFPNNLLVPLGSLYFPVEEINKKIVCDKPPLVIITTNEERDLPPAFLRRCVELHLEKPDLLEVGKAHVDTEEHIEIVKSVYKLLNKFVFEQNGTNVQSSSLSPAEFIDVVKACINLDIKDPEVEIWDMILKTIVWKQKK